MKLTPIFYLGDTKGNQNVFPEVRLSLRL
ncbi:hypothetical protein NQ317_019168 [Molorchus minor]|uniref:Uncharacterized protein n=1 Tax=Molorchus minor TaxID=1323400 RepID=A0ABQ9JSX8_9CUCU|nr:hypothetical protein NQ317_019168 [Molorchus minor]